MRPVSSRTASSVTNTSSRSGTALAAAKDTRYTIPGWGSGNPVKSPITVALTGMPFTLPIHSRLVDNRANWPLGSMAITGWLSVPSTLMVCGVRLMIVTFSDLNIKSSFLPLLCGSKPDRPPLLVYIIEPPCPIMYLCITIIVYN